MAKRVIVAFSEGAPSYAVQHMVEALTEWLHFNGLMATVTVVDPEDPTYPPPPADPNLGSKENLHEN